MRLWLVRHAAPCVEAGVCYGRSDVAADPQATLLAAQQVVRDLPADAALVCSPLQRCTQLADALRALRPTLSVRTDARLAEMDFGAWEGKPWEAIGQAAIDAWTASFATHRPGGGESVQDFMERVAQAYDEVRQARRETVWVTHAGVIRAARLLHAGVQQVTEASQWPADAPAFGSWEVLALRDE
jgi:alpha-ribazole phosphatase